MVRTLGAALVKKIVLAGMALATAALLSSTVVAGQPQPRGAFNTVTVSNNQFQPRVIPTETVTQGAIEIRWSGDSGGPHNVRQDDRLFYSGPPATPFGQFDE